MLPAYSLIAAEQLSTLSVEVAYFRAVPVVAKEPKSKRSVAEVHPVLPTYSHTIGSCDDDVIRSTLPVRQKALVVIWAPFSHHSTR